MIALTPDTPEKSWIYRIPIPQAKILLGIVLSVGTFLVVWVVMLLGKPVEEGTLAVLLTFVAALFGIAHQDYKVKRNTDLDYQAGEKATAVKVENAESVTVKPEHEVP